MKKVLSLCCIILISFSCIKRNYQPPEENIPEPPEPPVEQTDFVKGADVSWLTQMEASGIKFYDQNGNEEELMQLLKDMGLNTIRLRAWVDPAGGWNSTDDVVAKAVRAKDLGFKLLIDFHYSDTWADPGHQTKPAAWADQDFATLKQSVASYTTEVLIALKEKGITPEWVQAGNETNDGMLWPDGRASQNMSNFAALVNASYDAVKAVDNSIKVMVHISNGYDNSLFRWIFDGLKDNGAKWDVIGMSLYPTASNWSSLNEQCLANMTDMVSRYNKEIMVCEVGMSWTDGEACKSFLTDLIEKTRSLPDAKGLGVMYWEPEAYNKWQGYTLGAFDNDGKPTVALDAFK